VHTAGGGHKEDLNKKFFEGFLPSEHRKGRREIGSGTDPEVLGDKKTEPRKRSAGGAHLLPRKGKESFGEPRGGG